MNSLVAVKAGTTERVPSGFEEQLIWLQKFGQPRVSMASNGWHASITMNTNTTGTEFAVKSEFNHRLPSEAVTVLIERMLAALVALDGARK